jgi:hypothetical protein
VKRRRSGQGAWAREVDPLVPQAAPQEGHERQRLNVRPGSLRRLVSTAFGYLRILSSATRAATRRASPRRQDTDAHVALQHGASHLQPLPNGPRCSCLKALARPIRGPASSRKAAWKSVVSPPQATMAIAKQPSCWRRRSRELGFPATCGAESVPRFKHPLCVRLSQGCYFRSGQRPCKNGLKHRSGTTGAEYLTHFALPRAEVARTATPVEREGPLLRGPESLINGLYGPMAAISWALGE